VFCAAVAAVVTGGAGAGASDPALARQAVLRLSDFPAGWESHPERGSMIGTGLPRPNTALGAMCKRGFVAMQTQKPTGWGGMQFRGPTGLPSVTDSVVLFRTASAARRAYRALSGNALAACEAAAIKDATPPGFTFTFQSRYREPVIAKGTHTAIFGWNAIVARGAATAPVRFESIALLHGRSFAFMFFGSDLAARQVASQVSLINISARRLP
jgi:hypothetical protein